MLELCLSILLTLSMTSKLLDRIDPSGVLGGLIGVVGTGSGCNCFVGSGVFRVCMGEHEMSLVSFFRIICSISPLLLLFKSMPVSSSTISFTL